MEYGFVSFSKAASKLADVSSRSLLWISSPNCAARNAINVAPPLYGSEMESPESQHLNVEGLFLAQLKSAAAVTVRFVSLV